MKFFVAVFLFIFSLVFFGCEDDNLNQQAEFNTKIARIKCEKEFECCSTSIKPRHYETVEECIKYNEFLSQNSVDYLAFSNYTWNSENADKCLEYWNNYSTYSYSCTEDLSIAKAQATEESLAKTEELKSACNSLLEGYAQIGDKCYPDLSNGDGCSEGLTCNSKTYECEKTPRLGESCVEIEECYTDLEKEIYCDKTYKKDKDGNVETDTYGDPVLESATCKQMPVTGEDCSNTRDCDNNLENVFCEIIYKKDSEGDYEYDEATGERIIESATCKEFPKKGESCELSNHCYNENNGEIYCAREKNNEGEKSYFCREYPKANEPCGTDQQCAEGLICKYELTDENENSYSYFCREKYKEGAACEGTTECEDGLFCKFDDNNQGKCVKKYSADSECVENIQCLSGNCAKGDDKNYCLGTTLADQICVQYDYGDEYLF
ncbi:MAG TPA: hypothetical protein PKG52_09395 [bacterium]|nr:hypothetical protein [bacterium]HPS30720.1 hypothetical protein [bacterium]